MWFTAFLPLCSGDQESKSDIQNYTHAFYFNFSEDFFIAKSFLYTQDAIQIDLV